MMRLSSILLALALSLFLSAPLAWAETGPECLFGRARRLAEVEGPAGVSLELFPTYVRVGGRAYSPCNGLPGLHPTAVAAYDSGFAVGFRHAGVHVLLDGRFEELVGQGERSGSVRALASTEDGLWIGTTDGLFLQRDDELVRARHGRMRRTITALEVDEAGVLHIGVDPRGWWRRETSGRYRPVDRRALVGCFIDRRGRLGSAPPGPECLGPMDGSPLASGHVTALETHRGQLFVGTFDGGLVRSNGGSSFLPVAGAPRWINALHSDGEDLWAGSADGLFVARGEGGSFERTSLGLPSDHVNGVFRASTGELLVATSAGLVGFRGTAVRLLDERNGLPSRIVYAVTETDDGALWVATDRGVARLSHDGIDIFDRSTGSLPHDWATALLPRGRSVYAGTYDSGVAHLGPDGHSEPLESLGPLWINPHGIAALPDAEVAFATLGDGLWIDDGTTPRRVAGLPSNDVTAAVVFEDALWIGTRGGLARLAID